VKFLFIFLISISSTIISAQTYLNLKPNSTQGIDACIVNYPGLTTTNYGNILQQFLHAGTASSTDNFGRSLVKFDLSQLPNNIIIDSSYISLYAWGQAGGTGWHRWLSGSNVGWIERVISSWNESAVNWVNQPTTTTTNRVQIDSAKSVLKNYPRIDITNLINDIRDTINFGFMFRLQTEVKYRTLNFCSSDHPDSTRWPEIHVYYHSCLNNDSSTVNICPGDSIYLENQFRKISGWYVDSMKNMYGCDSLIYTFLDVSQSKPVVLQFQNFLYTPPFTGQTYQWIDCVDMKVILGATSSQYSPTKNGSFAVIVYNGQCEDTSECFEFISSGIDDFKTSDTYLNIYPNPSTGFLFIELKDQSSGKIEIINSQGSTVYIENLDNTSELRIYLSETLGEGLYFIRFTNQEIISTSKFVLSRSL